MIKEILNASLQNKNTVMFVTAIIFMLGILSYFNDCGIICSAIISILIIILIAKNLVPVKYLLFWIFIFYFGFFN